MEHSGPYGLGAGGGPRPPEHQPEEGARPEREVQKGVGKGCGTVHGPSRHGRQWSVPTWHMEHSGPYGLGAGGGPTGHQNTNLKKAHGRSERCKREWGRGAGQCTGHRVTVDVERANVAHGALRTIWSGSGWGANRPPEHQPEEGARPEREVQKGVGKGCGTVHGPSRHGRQWSVPTWHMEHSGPYGLGAGGGPQATRTPT
ncbi:hypothetical protein ERJ75_001298200 [Trypanosoma vivax]|nr:hypothetical protein ERJ75_001298200 [Trypanosoma vivax]